MSTLPILYLVSLPGPIASFIENSQELIANKDIFGLLIQWPILVVLGLIFVIGIVKKSKGITITLFSLYTLTGVFHYITVRNLYGADEGETLGNVGQIGIMALVFFVVAVVIAYFVFIRE